MRILEESLIFLCAAGGFNRCWDLDQWEDDPTDKQTVKLPPEQLGGSLADSQYWTTILTCFLVWFGWKDLLRQWSWGSRSDEGDLKPCHRWSHSYSKAPHEGSDWDSHPHTFSIITTTACVGAECFAFWCFFSREIKITPCYDCSHRGLESLSHPDLYLGVIFIFFGG